MKKFGIILYVMIVGLLLSACTPSVYTVTFDSDGGTVVTDQEVNDGEKATLPTAPEKEGYNFVYWYESDESVEFDFDSEITKNTTLTARWTEKELFTVSFNTDGGTVIDSQTIIDGELASEPEAVEKFGFLFIRWYTSDESVAYDFNSPVTGDKTINALWEEKDQFTVSFDSGIGSEIDDILVYDGEVVDLPSPPREATHDFVYWYVTDETVAFDETTPITEDITLTALWRDKEVYYVTFETDGGSVVEMESVMDGYVVDVPDEPQKLGYFFMGWSLTEGGEQYDFFTPITEDITLYALWSEKDAFTVVFDSTIGSEVADVVVYDTDLLVLPEEPVEATHNFEYWYVDDENVPFELMTPITSDLVLTAKWSERPLWDVTFNVQGGSTVESQVVMDGYVIADFEEPTYYGYEFVHWYVDDENVPFDLSTPIMESITLHAKWSLKPVYVVTFDVDGGSLIDPQNIIEGEQIILPDNPTKDGFRFMYWYVGETSVVFEPTEPIVGDITISAYWMETNALVFNSDGGSEVQTSHLLLDETTMEPEVPTRAGYRFVHWYETDAQTPFTFGGNIDQDVTLTALWQKVWTIRFYNFGTKYAEFIVDDGDLTPLPEQPVKTDYVFLHWYYTDSEEAFDFTTPITKSMNFKARWETPTERLIMEDMDAYGLLLDGLTELIPMPSKGEVHESTLKYYSESLYISDGGVILPLHPDLPEGTTGTWRVKFTLNGESYYRNYEIPLYHADDIVIGESRVVPFENLTTEYDVANSDVTLFFETGGNVPYIKLDDFFGLLQGFIDPTVPMTFTKNPDSLEVFYQYYDEDEDITYDLILTVDATENTIVTNDPGFYWAYIYSTETNYGRHIEYVQDHPDESSLDGNDVVYDLDDFNMDIVMYEGEVMIPYYMANQLFAGSAYYNVYYNYDGLYGIYSLPGDGSRELRTIQTSSKNNQDVPVDLLIHTFDMLAFNLDNLYGLKEIMEVETYYDLLYEMKDDLLVTDPEDLDVAIRDLLLKGLDEPHTSYGYHSYFNSQFYGGPVTNTLSVYGDRFVQWYYDGLIDTDDAIGAKWGEASSGWNVVNKPDYWWVDDNVVMLSLNGFVTSDIEESSVFDATIAQDMLEVVDITGTLPVIAEGNKFFYYNNSDENNRVIDILVKGVNASYVDTYEADLVSAGYTHIIETTNDQTKIDGYFSKTIGEIEYMVVVHFDETYSLLHVGIATYLPASYGSNWPVTHEVLPLIDSDSAVYMEFMLQEIEEENPLFTDIILDLSWNTGGNVGALYRVIGFITNSPFQVTRLDGDTDGAYTSYVDIVGVPDYSHKNWHLLTTPTSFSAANSLATIFRANDFGPIIGVQTGGGACSITPILLPNGTAFTMSSNNISGYRTGSGTVEDPYVYHDVEFGITPDFEIDISDIYTPSVLLDIINGSN